MEFDLESSQMDIWKLRKTPKAAFSHRDRFVRRYWDWVRSLVKNLAFLICPS